MKKTLNGTWSFREAGTDKWFDAKVPGCNYLDLIDNGIITDPFYGTVEKDVSYISEKDWEYKKVFEITKEELSSDEIYLNCDMLDTVCDLYINGEKAASCDNCFIGYSFSVKNYLKLGNNEISVLFYSPKEFVEKIYKAEGAPPNSNGQNGIVHIRKPQCHFGWDWGPILTPSGISGNIALEFVKTAKINDLAVKQVHNGGKVTVQATADLKLCGDKIPDCVISVTCPDGTVLKQNGTSAEFVIDNPELWWTYELSGKDVQPLYSVKAEISENGEALDEKEKRIGLRTIVLNQEKDQWGKNFQFVLNGVPIFAKGGNYIPPDTFITRFDAEQQKKLLEAVRYSNMNILRIWGGGYYGSDAFYNACDEMGILLWQDFQFACQAYPFFKESFLENVKKEIEYNVKRISHHPSLALWCGNNEIEEMHSGWMTYRNYIEWTEKFFWHILGDEIRKYDEFTPFIPGSPVGISHNKGVDCDNVGDTHLWAVWHGLKPMSFYRKRMTRFCSEFGFESLPDIKTIKTFAEEKDFDLNSEVFLSHQKCMNGNDKMVYYIASRFNLPKKFEDYIYLSQVTQAECIEDATAHWRRNKGRCNGAIYWQFNDCWPVCSWSSYDYYGNYKALQYAAKNFNAPLGISVEDDAAKVNVYVINDFNEEQKLTLEATGFELNGNKKFTQSKDLTLSALENKCVFHFEVKDFDKSKDGLCIRLHQEKKETLQKVILFKKEKELNLPSAKISMNCETDDNRLIINLRTDKFARLVKLESSLTSNPFSDNYFDMMAGEIKTVAVEIPDGISKEEFESSISVMSLCDVEKDPNKIKILKNKVKIFTSAINIGNAVWHGKIPGNADLSE